MIIDTGIEKDMKCASEQLEYKLFQKLEEGVGGGGGVKKGSKSKDGNSLNKLLKSQKSGSQCQLPVSFLTL